MLGSYKSNIEKGLRGNVYKGVVGRHLSVEQNLQCRLAVECSWLGGESYLTRINYSDTDTIRQIFILLLYNVMMLIIHKSSIYLCMCNLGQLLIEVSNIEDQSLFSYFFVFHFLSVELIFLVLAELML